MDDWVSKNSSQNGAQVDIEIRERGDYYYCQNYNLHKPFLLILIFHYFKYILNPNIIQRVKVAVERGDGHGIGTPAARFAWARLDAHCFACVHGNMEMWSCRVAGIATVRDALTRRDHITRGNTHERQMRRDACQPVLMIDEHPFAE